MQVVSQLPPLCVCQKSPKLNNFEGKRANEAKSGEPNSPNFTRCSAYSASHDKNSSQGELMKMKFCMYLVNYFYYVCAKFHPDRTTFSVKRPARRKVPGAKSTNFTRCSIYSASKDKISSKGELRKLKLCMYLVIYFYYLCGKFYQNGTTFSVWGLARKKLVNAKSTNVTRCSTYSASDHKTLSQGERRKLSLYM